MQFTKVLGLAAVGALLALAAPAERANALSLSNPGAAAAVQDDARLATTEVHWRHRHHHRWQRWPASSPSPLSSLAPLVSARAGARRQARSLRACFDLKGCLETGEIAARYL